MILVIVGVRATLFNVRFGKGVSMEIVAVERIPVDAGHVERSGRHMRRHIADWSISEVCKVITKDGLIGWGETIPHYTWGSVTDESVERVIGRNPSDFLWDDSLGAGLQQAMFDLVGKKLGVPAYRLVGPKVRGRCPVAWWCWDMPEEAWVGETRAALAAGYTSFKLKARPWHDLFAATEAISHATPEYCAFDLDFNSLLVTAGRAQEVLPRLEAIPKVHFFETPIPQDDVHGNKALRSKLRLPVAMHFDNPPFLTAVQEGVCDGWVLNQGAYTTVQQAGLAAAANMPFWLQLVGTGITTAFTLHLGASLSHAQWPAITCLNTYADDLLTHPIEIQRGYARVPELPGLGIEVDEDAIERLRRPTTGPHKMPRMIHTVAWTDGLRVSYTSHAAMEADFMAGNRPGFESGVSLVTEDDDGSEEFNGRWQQVLEADVLVDHGSDMANGGTT